MYKIVTIILTILCSICGYTQNIEDTRTNHAVESQLINHTGYKVSYNQLWCIPNWVAYELTGTEVEGAYPRRGSFCPDPQVVGCTANTYDYSGSGWDRGHMAPAADMKWTQEVMYESFYLSNICPQNPELNGGIWLALEERVRYWAKQNNSIFIVCGPIMEDTYETIGSNGVAIPSGFFKVLCKRCNNEYVAIGFVFPNRNCTGNIFDYACTIDAIEEMTGHDFFYILPDAVEHKIESIINTKDWD